MNTPQLLNARIAAINYRPRSADQNKDFPYIEIAHKELPCFLEIIPLLIGRLYGVNGRIQRKPTPGIEWLMSAIDAQVTERRLPDGQDMRFQIWKFQELFSISSYKNEAAEVDFVTEKFYEFIKDGLPFSRMLILRKELLATSKAKPRS